MFDHEPPPVQFTRSRPGRQDFACDFRRGARGVIWVEARGDLGTRDAAAFAEALLCAVADARLLIVDLAAVKFIDGPGLAALAKAATRARRCGRRMVLVRVPARVEAVVRLTGLSERLETIDLRPTLVPSVHSLDGAEAAAGHHQSPLED